MVKFLLLFTIPLILSAQSSEPETKDYEGPSILSRGGPASSVNRTPDISFRPYIGVSALYDTGFAGVVVRPDGTTESTDSIGLEGSAGIYGSHHFKRAVIGLNYRGDYQHFVHNSYGDTIDQMLTLQYDRQLTKRLSIGFTEAAGTYTRNYQFSSASGLIDPQALILPTNDLFDNRVIYGETAGGLVYRASPRLSFRFGGSGFLVRRRSSSLFGVTGYGADGDAVYRLTRFVSISALYSFQHFEFTRAFGASDIHTAGIGLAARLSRTVELSLQGGGSRVETLFLVAVPIDPVIAAITGQTTGIQAIHNRRYVPTGRIRLTKQMQQATAQLSYWREITPGNGVYLTSRNEGATAAFSYTGQRHWSFTASAGYFKMSALAQAVGTFTNYDVGMGVTRDLGHGLQWSFRGDDSRLATHYKSYNRNSARVSMGFYWSPGEVPLSLW